MVASAALLAGCAGSPPRGASPAAGLAMLDAEVAQLMQREQVNGLALAVIDKGQVVKVAAYGQRSVKRQLPLTTDTVMYGASLTKAAFAYMLLQLVDEGKLSLDASVADLLPKALPSYTGSKGYAELADDPRWRQLTPRILLTHSAGFANFRWLEPDKKLRIHFNPGTRYAYAGEGFYLLQRIVEDGLGLDAKQEMQRRVFDRFGMVNTSMQWRDDFAANMADGYDLQGQEEAHDERSTVSAAGSMDTTIADQARLWAGVVRGEGLSAASRAEMVKAQLAITSAHQFPTLAALLPEAPYANLNLAAGLGVVRFDGPQGPAWLKGGHNETTGNMVLCLETGQRCVVLLANDVRAERLYPEITRRVLGDTGMPWRWEYDWLPARP